jgi:hypothetical protein
VIEERRRLGLVRMQAMIAGLARREALRGLAEALDEERRRSALADRAGRLLAGSGARPGTALGEDITRASRFAAGVGRIAREAVAARNDARCEAAWQARLLATAEARSRRLAELEAAAESALCKARDRRAAPLPAAMARKLQSGE